MPLGWRIVKVGELAWPFQCLGNGLDAPRHRPILGFQPALGRQPPVARDAEKAAAIDHFTARLGYWGNSKFHSASHGHAIPRRVQTAVVLFPNAHPRKLRLRPDVAEREVTHRGPG